MGDRIGRNGRLLGKRGPDIDRLDDEAKKRLLELSGILDDDIGAEERDGLVKVLLESNPDFLKAEENKKEDVTESDDRSQTSALSQPSPGSVLDDNEEDEATQPPDQVLVEDDAGMDSREDHNKHQGMVLSNDVIDRQAADENGNNLKETEDNSNVASQNKPHQDLCDSDVEGIDGNNSPEIPGYAEDITATNTVKSKLFEVDNSSDCSEKQDEETQLYVENVVQDTQRSEKSSENEPDIIIPESPDNDGHEGGEKSLFDKRLEKEGDSRSQRLTSSLKTCDICLSQNIPIPNQNPLLPSLYCGDSAVDKNCYSQVVKLMFDLYRRRVSREQRRLHQSLKWGSPVEVGLHMEDCLRLKGVKKTLASTEETGEGWSRKSRILRRHGNGLVNSKSKEDPYVLNISDKEDKNESDNDFQTTSLALNYQTLVQTEAVHENESKAFNLTMEGSSRRSARLCTIKLAQSRGSESEENDQGEDEWNPGQRKPKRKSNLLKRKGTKRGQKKGENLKEKISAENKETQKNLSKTDTETGKDKAEEWNKETLNLERSVSTKDTKISSKIQLAIVKHKPDVDHSSPPYTKKYKFISDSEDETIQQNSNSPQQTSPCSDHTAVEYQRNMSEKLIVLSDSDQSNDTEKTEHKDPASSSHSLKILKHNEKVMSHTNGEQVSVDVVDKTLKSTVTLDKQQREAKSNVQMHTDEPSWSQGSNSLLDQNGLLFSTQINRHKKNKDKSDQSTEDLVLQTVEKGEIVHPPPDCNTKSMKEFDRKRKAPEVEDLSSKRKALTAVTLEKKTDSQVQDRKALGTHVEDETNPFISLRSKQRGLKPNLNLTTNSKSVYFSVAEDEQPELVTDLTKPACSRPTTSYAETKEEPVEARGEDPQQQVQPGTSDAAEEQRQATLFEELINEQDEKALQPCPICGREFPLISIEAHASTCGEEEMDQNEQERDQRCNYCGDTFDNEGFQEHVLNCESAQNSGRRFTRSRRDYTLGRKSLANTNLEMKTEKYPWIQLNKVDTACAFS
ncbi:hypothetical protein ElyMa_006781800 [Elysia marginata]|uniref:UBZ4-type domain-containing protein n=1 Tax=Elysia marginata TaxID=1093978 RepID=A0AAV4J1Z1_9GAST|nr:hypothetical protein ElyMa_006781800 [Elysia marginata]